MADFDAIVVGGGPNGLAAALRLAESGWTVCLLEATEELGGAARTVECTEEDSAPETSKNPCEVASRDLIGGGWFGWLGPLGVARSHGPVGGRVGVAALGEEGARLGRRAGLGGHGRRKERRR